VLLPTKETTERERMSSLMAAFTMFSTGAFGPVVPVVVG
jgi:hypothetical protein